MRQLLIMVFLVIYYVIVRISIKWQLSLYNDDGPVNLYCIYMVIWGYCSGN
jgi:hypothetical protein